MATKKTAVLYHYPCPDGAFAALAAHLYFSATSTPALYFPNTVYNPLRAEELPLHEIGDVYLLDFMGPFDFLQEISSKVGRVMLLDHHKTALETLTGNSSIGENVHTVIDFGRSGATIAFDYFKEKVIGSSRNLDNHCGEADVCDDHEIVLRQYERVKELFRYIEDGDLWRWRLQNSKAFSSGLKDLNIEYNVRLNPSLFEQVHVFRKESQEEIEIEATLPDTGWVEDSNANVSSATNLKGQKHEEADFIMSMEFQEDHSKQLVDEDFLGIESLLFVTTTSPEELKKQMGMQELFLAMWEIRKRGVQVLKYSKYLFQWIGRYQHSNMAKRGRMTGGSGHTKLKDFGMQRRLNKFEDEFLEGKVEPDTGQN